MEKMTPLENSQPSNDDPGENQAGPGPSRQEAEDAIRTLIRWAGDDPDREGLEETPARVARAYEEYFAGYKLNAEDALNKSFEDIPYHDFVLVKDIDFIAHCEHHMVPIVGRAHVAYWPDQHIAGISKLARLVDVYAKRLITQEKMTFQIAHALDTILGAKGSAVMIDAVHHCMSFRGITKPNSSTVTSTYTGIFEEQAGVRERFLSQIKS